MTLDLTIHSYSSSKKHPLVKGEKSECDSLKQTIPKVYVESTSPKVPNMPTMLSDPESPPMLVPPPDPFPLP